MGTVLMTVSLATIDEDGIDEGHLWGGVGTMSAGSLLSTIGLIVPYYAANDAGVERGLAEAETDAPSWALSVAPLTDGAVFGVGGSF